MEEMRNGERLKMRHWLQNAIDSGEFDGVEWTDKREGKFRVPWKHASRHGWDIDRDACIFKRWAIYTGKYSSEPKPLSEKKKRSLAKLWKANFRCALNALQDIEVMRKEGKSRGRDAYKVFRLKPQNNDKKQRSKTTKIRLNSTGCIDSKEEDIKQLRRIKSLPLKSPYPDPVETNNVEAIVKQEDGADLSLPWQSLCNTFPFLSPPSGIGEDQNGTMYQHYQLQQYNQQFARVDERSDYSDVADSDSIESSHSSDTETIVDAPKNLLELFFNPDMRQLQEFAGSDNPESSVVTQPINSYNTEFFPREDLMLSAYSSRSQSLRMDHTAFENFYDQQTFMHLNEVSQQCS